MNETELKLRVNFAFAKCRNIIYYMMIDDRSRSTYIHVVRDLRNIMLELVNMIPEGNEKTMMSEIIKMINPKVKSEDCFRTMMDINKKFNFINEQQ